MNFKIKDDVLVITLPPKYEVTELSGNIFSVSMPGNYRTILTKNLLSQDWIEDVCPLFRDGKDLKVRKSNFVEAEQAKIALSHICEYVLSSNHEDWLNNASESEIVKWVCDTFGDEMKFNKEKS